MPEVTIQEAFELRGGGIRTPNGIFTRPIRWHEICRAALVMGHIKDYSKGECLKLARELDKRAKAGKVIRDKRGVYRGFVPPHNWNKEGRNHG
jgi:hypothetical protein